MITIKRQKETQKKKLKLKTSAFIMVVTHFSSKNLSQGFKSKDLSFLIKYLKSHYPNYFLLLSSIKAKQHYVI